ncbi:MAG: UDP-3-O-acyl-N-acetylglucosamine deacetylase [Thermoguttaceae bacterium]|jgi:UDP-3-O-acyl N-acetylglucosamine deacetylase|nr:UDP-3-O-acyl-N-acetylglucosamine deacetylase [Thermoguttaceae bacterium]
MFQIPKITRIESTRQQRTLADQVDIEGFGFWSSKDVLFSFRPAPENSGIRFFRADLPNSPPIPALVYNRIKKPRQTSLVVGSAQVDMVEHALAALHGAQIDNCDIIVNAQETPGLDGSASAFINAFLEVGAEEQDRERIRLKILDTGIFAENSEPNGRKIVVAPNEQKQTIFKYDLRYDIPGPIPNQTAIFNFSQPPEIFKSEIAPCRTFLTFEEACHLREQGICLRVGAQDVLVYGKDGPIDNKTRFDNECARHKILDMIGDFSLAPVDWEGEFHAAKTGHQQNADVLLAMLNSLPSDYLK